MTAVGLLKLDEAAARLGCHVETLRVHIRDGRLRAIRGPHGAFYLDARDVAIYPRPQRGCLSSKEHCPSRWLGAIESWILWMSFVRIRSETVACTGYCQFIAFGGSASRLARLQRSLASRRVMLAASMLRACSWHSAEN